MDRIAYQNKFNLTPQKMLIEDIDKGKFPEIVSKRFDL